MASGVDLTWMWIALALAAVLIWGFRLGIRHAVRVINRAAAAEAKANTEEPSEEALVNLKTGEVVEPGTRAFERARTKAKVEFK